MKEPVNDYDDTVLSLNLYFGLSMLESYEPRLKKLTPGQVEGFLKFLRLNGEFSCVYDAIEELVKVTFDQYSSHKSL